jgi:short-subunit dehydrogenase
MSQKPVALITGASRGIGRAIAHRLAKEGYDLALIARNKNSLDGLVQKVQELYGIKAFALAIDLENLKAIPQAVNDILRQCGRIDVIVNNAGINVSGTLSATDDDFLRCFTVNVAAPRAIIKALQPHLESRGSGNIINVSSISGLIGFPEGGAYGSTKRALLGLNESLFNELVPKGIKVTALCPSWVDTDMASYAGFSGSLMIQPEDMAETVVFLTRLSPQACIREIRVDCVHVV